MTEWNLRTTDTFIGTFVLCREVVLFSEVMYVLKLYIMGKSTFGELKNCVY